MSSWSETPPLSGNRIFSLLIICFSQLRQSLSSVARGDICDTYVNKFVIVGVCRMYEYVILATEGWLSGPHLV
ncbi:hypothetical protein F5Y12DRAFT_750855 [Xylaria sp. FL1777]|nr:hypothetical protein F5Y12DRAFT_750855 [Xylaria sp. FL1777]